MLTLSDISAIHIPSCPICLNSALFASIQQLSTLYLQKFVLQNWFMSIYANRKSLCSGNFSNPDKLPGEFHPVVFGFYVTWVSIYANCKWLCCCNLSNSKKLPGVSFILLYLVFMSLKSRFMLILLDISAIHVQSCPICLDSALLASIQQLSTLYIQMIVLW